MGYYNVEEQIEAMKGRVLESVELDASKEHVTFTFQDGYVQRFGVEGDCCSHSWIEHLELPGNVKGLTLCDFAEDSMDVTDMNEYNPVTRPEEVGQHYGNPREHESLMKYQSRFITDRGEIVLEYRNSSNGYYGGYLVVA